MDTQIGTRPQIGALEIHQAYILASLNWLQQTRSLEMNHVAIEKAEKAKLLGFDHSSVITDAEKYMNNLETFKCYNFFSQNFPGCIILKEEDFINLNVKYGLVSFTETEIRVMPRSIDPFVFQVTPVGVVIYSKWGEEASDAIFDNVKPL